MAHVPPSAAIFSPSVARAAASTAKDWSYVDSWLSAKFQGRRAPPRFERNADTLKSLLALASANEAADQDRDLRARVDAAALAELQAYRENESCNDGRDVVLDNIEENLSREGKVALDALAAAAVELGVAYPEPQTLGSRMVASQAEIYALEEQQDRVGVLQRYLQSEQEKMNSIARELECDGNYRQAPDLAKQNLDLQRKVKAAAARLPEIKNRLDAFAASVGLPEPTIEQLRKEEDEYLQLLAQKKDLDVQVRSFQGLPPDTTSARRELEKLRGELSRVRQQRDAVFEGLVERETPRKGR